MFWTVTRTLLEGFGTTVEIFALTLVFALPLGLVVAAGSMSKWAPFRALARPDSPGVGQSTGRPAAHQRPGGRGGVDHPGHAADAPADRDLLRARHDHGDQPLGLRGAESPPPWWPLSSTTPAISR